jgi:dynein heavy chain
MYLEVIFIGNEDIRRQLPQESAMFEGVHQAFMAAMARLRTDGNAAQATTVPGVLAVFQVGASRVCLLQSCCYKPPKP